MNYDKQKSVEIEQERLNLKLKKEKERKAEENKRKIDLRRIEEKQLAGLRYKKHLRNDQRKRDQKESERTDRGRMRKAEDEARQNIKRDIEMGLTSRQIRRKYLDEKATIRELNKDAQRETNKMLRFTNLSKLKINLDDLV